MIQKQEEAGKMKAREGIKKGRKELRQAVGR